MKVRHPLLLAVFFLLYPPGNVVFADGTSTNRVARPENWAIKLQRPGLPNLHQVTTNLYRGAQPTAEGMATLKSMGIKTVVNLRNFHSDTDELSGINVKAARLHMNPWHAEDEDVIQFLKIVSNTNNLPAFVHCQRGADRTGMMCAMYRITVCGWTREEAIRELRDGGFNFNTAWKNIIRYIENADVKKIKERAGLVAGKS
ncbi:MAG TPA: tyrosine-protein phosphatase [Candidatus Paceibacterota bacterium]|nr:tyrosine-protein phosphatase [Candidatus Paceibacterota bacterium]